MSILGNAVHEMSSVTDYSTQLDRWVDFTRDCLLVLYAVLSAFLTLTQTDTSQVYWPLVVIGLVTIYALYLPYKRASLMRGQLSLIARARVLRTIVVGIPVWLGLTALFITNPTYMLDAQAYLADPSSTGLFRVVVPVLVLIPMSADLAFEASLKRLLGVTGYGAEEAAILSDYLKSRGFRDLLMVSFMVLYVLLNVASGYSAREQTALSFGYFAAATTYIGMLIVYGFFYAWYLPERYTSDSRLILEGLLLLFVVVSPVNVVVGFALVIILLFLLYIKTRLHEEVDIESILAREKKEREKSWAYRSLMTFSERHRRFTRAYFMMLSMSALIAMVLIIFDSIFLWLSIVVMLGGFLLYCIIVLIWTTRPPEGTT